MCVFVYVLMAKTTIGKSMCVFVSIRVCVCVQSVCVFVCNPCVCLWPIFHRKLRGLFGHALKNARFVMLHVFLRLKWPVQSVCVFVGVKTPRILMGKTQFDTNGSRRTP